MYSAQIVRGAIAAARSGGGSGVPAPSGTLVLQILAEGANGSTSFPDTSGLNKTVSVTVGSVTVSTALAAQGSASALFAGGRLFVANDTDFDFGTGDFDVRMKVRRTTSAAHFVFDMKEGGSVNPFGAIYSDGGNQLQYFANGATRIVSNTAYVANTWLDIVLKRVSNVTALYVGSSLIGSFADTFNYNGAHVRIGGLASSAASFEGNIDAIEIRRG